jgi:hypothetical protein
MARFGLADGVAHIVLVKQDGLAARVRANSWNAPATIHIAATVYISEDSGIASKLPVSETLNSAGAECLSEAASVMCAPFRKQTSIAANRPWLYSPETVRRARRRGVLACFTHAETREV